MAGWRSDVMAPTSGISSSVFDDLYETYRGPLYNYMYRLLGDREQADDLVQADVGG